MLEIRRETAENGEPKTMSTTADKAQAPVSNAKAIRSECSREIGAALKDEARAALRIGVALNLASSTFTVEEREAWQAWATSVTRKSWKTCQSYMAVAKTHGKLTRQADRRSGTGSNHHIACRLVGCKQPLRYDLYMVCCLWNRCSGQPDFCNTDAHRIQWR